MTRPEKTPAPAPARAPVNEMQQRLEQALAERDAALTALAVERELTNALRLQGLSAHESPPPNYPETAAPGPAPLRYVVVDAANDALKTVLGPFQGSAKKFASLLLKPKP